MSTKSDIKVNINIKDEEGKVLITDDEKGTAFFQQYIKQMNMGNSEECTVTTGDTIYGFVQSEFMEVPTEVEEVRKTINFAKNEAPSPDGVQYGHLVETDNEVVWNMTKEYNYILLTGEISDKWFHSYLVPLLKTGKDNTRLMGITP